MHGYETCKKLKKNETTASILVVFLTENSSNEAEEMGLENRPAYFILKPISTQIFSTRESNIIKLLAATRKLELLASTGPLACAYYRRDFMETGDYELLRSKRCDDL